MIKDAHSNLFILAYLLAKAFNKLFFAGKGIKNGNVHDFQVDKPTCKLKSFHHHFIRTTEANHNILSLKVVINIKTGLECLEL